MALNLTNGANIGVRLGGTRVGISLPGAGSPVQTKAGLWTGEGPPPDTIPGAAVGDEYLDTITGDLYRLEPGD